MIWQNEFPAFAGNFVLINGWKNFIFEEKTVEFLTGIIYNKSELVWGYCMCQIGGNAPERHPGAVAPSLTPYW